jgi:hypothetical protein
MTLKTILRDDDEYCDDIRTKRSPIHISKKEIQKMTMVQLKDVLDECNEKKSGNKHDLVDRVYKTCKRELVKRVQRSCSRRSKKSSRRIEFPYYSDSNSCGTPKCNLNNLSRKQIIDALRRIGITHARKNLDIDTLKDIYNAPRCNIENNQFCSDDQYCDLRDKVCTTPDYALSRGVVEAELNGHKVIGSVDMISNLADKLNISCDKSKWVHLNGVTYNECSGDNYRWKTGSGCYGRVQRKTTCSSSSSDDEAASKYTSVPSSQSLIFLPVDKFTENGTIDNVVNGSLKTPPPTIVSRPYSNKLGLNEMYNLDFKFF